MPLKENIKRANNDTIRAKTAKGSITRAAIADGLDAGLDYTDEKVAALAEKFVSGDDLDQALEEMAKPIQAALTSLLQQFDQLQNLASPQALAIDVDSRTALVPEGYPYTIQELK